MKRSMVCLLFGLLWLGADAATRAAEAGMRASKPDVKKEIVGVIEAQLAAFRKGDGPTAYSYAAAELRAKDPLRVFLAIVRTNYPEIWTNARADFGIVRDDGARATLLVHVYGKESDASYDFTLVKESGGWRIHDVLRHETAKGEKV